MVNDNQTGSHVFFIDLGSIKVPEDRQRKEFEPQAMADLSDSISRIGLLHPIIIEDDGDLRAGERRFRAVSNLHMLGVEITFLGGAVPAGTIPCLRYSDLDELTRLEIEYDENHKRQNLTWQESAAATAKLFELRSKQAEASGNPPPTISSIADEVRGPGLSAGRKDHETKRELLVARHLEKPEVAKAKTLDEAFKILKKEEAAQQNRDRAFVVGQTYTSSVHTAVNADFVKWAATQPDGHYDLILTDPPYGMGADEFGDAGTGSDTHHLYKDDWDSVGPVLRSILSEGFRLSKTQAHLYMFCDIDHFAQLKVWAAEAGWRVFRTPLIWQKLSALRAPWPEHGPRRHYETILYAVKGDRKVTALFPDVLTYAIVGNQSEYQAQKPAALFADLIRRSCQAGDKILDPCMGSGTIFEAAHTHKCIATGVEILPEAYGIAVKRLGELK